VEHFSDAQNEGAALTQYRQRNVVDWITISSSPATYRSGDD
jgi:hypothetical protein